MELTGLMRESTGGDLLANWPPDMRVIVRRERPTPVRSCPCSKKPTGGDTNCSPPTPRSGPVTGWASWRSCKNVTVPTPKVEDTIRNSKNTGLNHLPMFIFRDQSAWCLAVGIADDLLAWLRMLCLSGDLATEPKTLRYRILHTAARLIRGQRLRKIRIPTSWP